MSYENEKNISSETETLSSDEQRVSRLLSNLKRVDAPGDFDFHLKARLANASPDDYRRVRLFPILKYAMPLALFLFVGGAFILNSSYSGWNVPPVADLPSASDPISNTMAVFPPKYIAPEPTTGGDDLVADSRSIEPGPTATEKGKEPKLANPRRPDGRGGSMDSFDRGLGIAPPPIPVLTPRHSNSNLTSNSAEAATSGALEFRQVLRSIGINADQSEGGWTVRSLVKNGVAERSGLRVGDLMEAIDDKPINTLYDGSFSVKSISVRRGDNVVKIEIQNK